MDINLWRAQGMKHPGFGDWWTPNLENTEPYRKQGPLSTRIGKAKTNLEDYKKAVLRALLKGSHNSRTLSNPLGIPLQDRIKELDKAVDDLQKGKITLKEFTSNFPEGNYLRNEGLKPKTSFYQTAKPALKVGTKFLGPLGIAYGIHDYFSGSPAGEGSTLDNNTNWSTYKTED